MSLETIQELMSVLTLEEKIGQLSMGAAGFARTGPIVTEDVEESVRSGKIGSCNKYVRRRGKRAQAVVATWFLGSEAGNAVAEVIRGVYNPTGRLPITWPRHVGQAPIFFSQRLTGRPYNADDRYTSKYIDLPVDPLLYFGHGMSYCDFAISDIRANGTRFTSQDTIDIEADVTNHGAVFGEETVFLFARDEVASVAPPRFELKGVAKIALGPKSWDP